MNKKALRTHHLICLIFTLSSLQAADHNKKSAGMKDSAASSSSFAVVAAPAAPAASAADHACTTVATAQSNTKDSFAAATTTSTGHIFFTPEKAETAREALESKANKAYIKETEKYFLDNPFNLRLDDAFRRNKTFDALKKECNAMGLHDLPDAFLYELGTSYAHHLDFSTEREFEGKRAVAYKAWVADWIAKNTNG